MWRVVPKRAVSGAIGWGARRGIPGKLRRLMLARFARAYGIDVSEAEKPLSDYAGFDEFFTRRLRTGARPIADAPGGIGCTVLIYSSSPVRAVGNAIAVTSIGSVANRGSARASRCVSCPCPYPPPQRVGSVQVAGSGAGIAAFAVVLLE